MATEARNEINNHFQTGMVGHWLNLNDGELYIGRIVGVVHDRTSGDLKINITLATETGFITIRVY